MPAHANAYTRVGKRAPSQSVVADQTTRTYCKNGITLAGRYYGEGSLEPEPRPDPTEGARALHPVNRRRFERQERKT